MSDTIKVHVLCFLADMAGVIMRIVGSTRVPRSAFIIPTSTPANGGDETMAKVCFDQALRLGASTITVMTHYDEREWTRFGPPVRCTPPLNDLLSKPIANVSRIFRFFREAASHESAMCCTGDMLDGHYDKGMHTALSLLVVLRFLRTAGVKVRIVGTSINSTPKRESILGLRICSRSFRVFARDPITLDRMQQHGVRAQLSADIAFLTKKNVDPGPYKPYVDQLSRAKESGRTIIGFNVHFIHATHEDQQRSIVSTIVNTIADIRAKRSAEHPFFVLIGHDSRPSQNGALNSFELLDMVCASLSSELLENTVSLPQVELMDEKLRSILKLLDISVAGSMHYALACFSEAIPTFCITYQEKFEGLFATLGLQDYQFTIPDVDFLHRTSIAEEVLPLIDKAPSIRRTLEKNLPDVMEKSALNFEHLFA